MIKHLDCSKMIFRFFLETVARMKKNWLDKKILFVCTTEKDYNTLSKPAKLLEIQYVHSFEQERFSVNEKFGCKSVVSLNSILRAI